MTLIILIQILKSFKKIKTVRMTLQSLALLDWKEKIPQLKIKMMILMILVHFDQVVKIQKLIVTTAQMNLEILVILQAVIPKTPQSMRTMMTLVTLAILSQIPKLIRDTIPMTTALEILEHLIPMRRIHKERMKVMVNLAALEVLNQK